MGSEDQALTVQSKKSITDYHKGKHSHQKYNPRRYNNNLHKFKFYTCDERGNFAKDCPRNKNGSLLALRETPLGCNSRMPGNLNVFNGFSKWIKLDDLQDLTLPKHA